MPGRRIAALPLARPAIQILPPFPLISLWQANVTKVGIVFVVLTAVALKTEDLKIIDRILASFATGDDMVNMKRSVFCGCTAGLAMSVAFENLIPKTVRDRIIIDHSVVPDSHPALHDEFLD
jgi:hypothetical protein